VRYRTRGLTPRYDAGLPKRAAVRPLRRPAHDALAFWQGVNSLIIPSPYRDVLDYFRPRFMLGMTATPDRLDRRDIFELFDYNKA
jgi:hypothetical protein